MEPYSNAYHVEKTMRCQEKKDAELWTGLISRAYHNFSLWHHEFIKADMSAALAVLH